MEERLAFAEERLTALFFLMCRDVMAAASVEGLVRAVSGTKFTFEPPELEEFARRLAKAMMSTSGETGPIDTKERREWNDQPPQRARDSRFFDAVLDEMGRLAINHASTRSPVAQVGGREGSGP